MRAPRLKWILVVIAGLGSACQRKPASPSLPAATAQQSSSRGEPGGPSGHGRPTPVGPVDLAGWQFDVDVLGTLGAGRQGALQASPTRAPKGKSLADISVYLWFEDPAGKPIGAPVRSVVEGGALHFHPDFPTGEPPVGLTLRIRDGETDQRARLALRPDAIGPAAPDGTHGGVVTAFTVGGRSGFVEVKLHADHGDLEVWLGLDRGLAVPFDLPLATTPTLTFPELPGRTLNLAPRDTTTNADEGGKANVREGKTNYFIFPGKTGPDASFLRNPSFESTARLSFPIGDAVVDTGTFTLLPHREAPGTHAHPHAH